MLVSCFCRYSLFDGRQGGWMEDGGWVRVKLNYSDREGGYA